MAVINMRKDGTIIEDLTVIVIKHDEFPDVYHAIWDMEKRLREKKEREICQQQLSFS